MFGQESWGGIEVRPVPLHTSSSAQGKAYHRAVRHRLVGLLQANAPASQAGAIPGVGIEAISLLARTFQYARQHQRKMWALTFFDFKPRSIESSGRLLSPAILVTGLSASCCIRQVCRLRRSPSWQSNFSASRFCPV